LKVRINQDKLDELKHKLKPDATWLALIGIVFFFFVPEIVAFFWGVEVKQYFYSLASYQANPLLQKAYKQMGDMLSENSILNIMIGLGFVWWWIIERRK